MLVEVMVVVYGLWFMVVDGLWVAFMVSGSFFTAHKIFAIQYVPLTLVPIVLRSLIFASPRSTSFATPSSSMMLSGLRSR